MSIEEIMAEHADENRRLTMSNDPNRFGSEYPPMPVLCDGHRARILTSPKGYLNCESEEFSPYAMAGCPMPMRGCHIDRADPSTPGGVDRGLCVQHLAKIVCFEQGATERSRYGC